MRTLLTDNKHLYIESSGKIHKEKPKHFKGRSYVQTRIYAKCFERKTQMNESLVQAIEVAKLLGLWELSSDWLNLKI